MEDLRPLFEFGLGWMGFSIGTQLDLRRIERLPETSGTLLALQVILPAAAVVGLCLPILRALGVAGDDLVRDLALLAGCAATAAPAAARRMRGATGKVYADAIGDVVALDAVAALATLGAVSIWLRPDAAATNWSLPPLALLILLLGLGALCGVLAHIILRGTHASGEEPGLLIGVVALTAGMAEYLALSGPVVCAIAGAVLTNLGPADERPGYLRVLKDIERPLYLTFLVIVGASWRAGAPEAWALALAQVVGRIGGKCFAAAVAARLAPTLPPPQVLARVLVPQGPVAVLVMASAATLHGATTPDPIRWAIHALIVSAVATEAFSRLALPRPAMVVA
jgi:Kef-type K+ transport system membrane component KefB